MSDVFDYIRKLEANLSFLIKKSDADVLTAEMKKLDTLMMSTPYIPDDIFVHHLVNKMVICANTGRWCDVESCVNTLRLTRLSPDIGIVVNEVATELYLRLGNLKEAEKSIVAWEKLISPIDHNALRQLDAAKGRLKSIQRPFGALDNVIDMLGEAELCGDMRGIAKSYIQIAKELTLRFPWLGISFFRKAERYAKDINDTELLLEIRCQRAKHYAAIYFSSDNPSEEVRKAYDEAKNIIGKINIEKIPIVIVRAFYYDTRAFILSNYDDYDKSLQIYEKEGILSEILHITEQYVMLCLSNGDFDKAAVIFEKYKTAAIRVGNRDDNIKSFEYLVNNKVKINRIFFKRQKSKGLPTLLEILDEIARREEHVYFIKRGTPFQYTMSSLEDDGKFEAITMPDGMERLFPCAELPFTYYRGQSERFVPCKPTLYRNGMTEAKKYVERLRYEEFKQLVDSHPASNLFATDFFVNSANGPIPLTLNVDHYALAQHYGIKTELMDLTTDKFVAAFFACTYRDKDGQYQMMKESDKPGVFYVYSYVPPIMPTKRPEPLPVGLQPFSRPGEQRGYVLKMISNQDFDEMKQVEVKEFRHDEESSRLIFNYTNRQKRLFPEDALDEKVDVILNTKVFSESARQQCKQEFYKNTSEEVINEYIHETNITFQASPIVFFSEEEINDFHAHARQKQEEWKSKIKVNLVYKGPINEVSIDEYANPFKK